MRRCLNQKIVSLYYLLLPPFCLMNVFSLPEFDIDSPSVLYDRLLLCYLLLYRDSANSITDIMQVIEIIFKRTMPSSELVSAVFSLIPDLFINQLVQIIKQYSFKDMS